MGSPVVLGVDFGGSKIAAAVADLSGPRLGQVVTNVEPADDAARTFVRGIDAAQRLLGTVAVDRQLVAVAACTFGIPHDDRVELAPTINGWEQLPFGALLQAAFPHARVQFATDVKAAARAELDDGALAGCEVGLYVNLGTGFAVALVVGGAVVSGQHGAAGEIGYNLLRTGTRDGRRLEDVVGGKALAAHATRLLGRADVTGLFAATTVDSRAAAVCREFVDELAFHLANLAVALDPERVVVGGGLVRAWQHLQPPLAAALAQTVPYPPELVMAAHPYDAPLLGALALAGAAGPALSPVAAALSEGAPA